MPAKTPHMLIRPTGSDTRCAALFASSLQPSHTPTASMIATAIRACPAGAPGPALARAPALRLPGPAQRRGPPARWSKFPGFRDLRVAGRAYGGPHARAARHDLRRPGAPGDLDINH